MSARTLVVRCLVLSGLALQLPAEIVKAESDEATVVKVMTVERATGDSNRHYVGNRPPLAPSPLVRLPIGSIRPHGWLRHMLELERNGMTGRLREISPWLDRQQSAWAQRDGAGS